MGILETYFEQNTGRLIHKWQHYFDIYERHFQRFKGKEVTILEIGVSQGGSLEMWNYYFEGKAKIYGIDINPLCKQFEGNNTKIFIGSQSDRAFLNQIKKEIPKVDILIDDGGHTMKQQIVSFEELFNHVKDDGIYICEDLLTSYWINYGGGYKRKYSFIEYSKNFIDYINAWYANQKKLKINDFTRSVDSLHYYNSMLVIEKRPVEKPYAIKKGQPSFVVNDNQEQSFGNKLRHITNFILSHLGLPNVE